MSRLAVDTSVAVPFLLLRHEAHGLVRERLADDDPVLTGHSLAETYSVLTRLPGDARLAPADAAVLLSEAFGDAVLPEPESLTALPSRLAPLRIAGGAVYDALVAVAARDRGLPLATRDGRAEATYRTLGVDVRLIVA